MPQYRFKEVLRSRKLTATTTALGVALLATSGCYSLRPPVVTQSRPITNYQFAVIESSETISSFAGGANGYGGYAMSQQTNPSLAIEGFLLKRGIVRAPSGAATPLDKTIVVRWGISGKRSVSLGLGYTQEVSIAFLDAQSLQTVFSCTAEGIGSTEADDIREAVGRCLAQIR